MGYSHHYCVHGLFAEQAARAPSAPAIVQRGRTMSYGEVAAEADRIGRRLRGAGVGPDTVVGLYTGRSMETVCAILAILAAGGAVCPLDPRLPAARLRFMIADAAPAIVLGRDRLPPVEGPLPVDVRGDNLAYVTYTSGSTGLPKAVANEHRGLADLVRFTREQMAIEQGDRLLQFANLSFDASLWEIFCALGSGATLVLGDEESLMPGPGLHALLREHRVTIVLLSPSVLRVLRPEGLDALRIVVAGTEKCGADVVRRWAPQRRFFNAYGPTESSVYSTIFEVGEVIDESPSIGTSVPGTDVTIVDGELWISGIGLARGYLNRPELTAERFVTLAGEARAYRTGDRASWRKDGNLEYLGRLDAQLKIRGHRIEAGEIETVLEAHPAVAAAVVVAVTNGRGDRSLWACWEPAPGHARRGTEADLVEHIHAHLPCYMVPQRFIEVDHWHLNANGKLDRAAVERSCELRRETPAEPPLESDGEEARLLARCRAIIDEPELGTADNLLAAGFTSLAVAELLWIVQEDFGVTLAYSDVFAAGNVGDLAELVHTRRASTEIQPDEFASSLADGTGDWPVSAAQRRFYLLRQHDPGSPGYHIECHLELRHRYDLDELAAILGGLVRRHELLRTTFHVVGGEIVQRVHEDAPIEVRRFSPDEPLDVIRGRFVRPFDFEQAPLVRAGVIVRSNDEFLLMLDVAHIIADARSTEILMAEIRQAYDGLPVPTPRATYRDYARWHNARLERNHSNHVADYWRRELADLPSPLSFPARMIAPDQSGGAVVVADLGATRTAALRRLAASADVTPFALLGAIYSAFLSRLTGRSDVVFGTVFGGRERPDLRDVFGPFVHLIPLRARPAPQKTFRQLAREVARTVQVGLDHRDFDFDLVRPGGALYNTGFTLQLVHNPQNDRTYARDIPWAVDLNVEACDVDGATRLRFILGRFLRAVDGGALLVEAFTDVVDRVLADPAARLATLTDRGTRTNAGARMTFAFDRDE